MRLRAPLDTGIDGEALGVRPDVNAVATVATNSRGGDGRHGRKQKVELGTRSSRVSVVFYTFCFCSELS
jgi:hypothetical protein